MLLNVATFVLQKFILKNKTLNYVILNISTKLRICQVFTTIIMKCCFYIYMRKRKTL